MEINRVGVVGLGTMGAGIAEVFAKSGATVIGVDRDEPSIERGRTIIATSLNRALSKGRLTQDQVDAATNRITFTEDRGLLADVDLVVEAIPEILEWKEELFTALDQILDKRTVLATNTSSLSIATLAAFTSRRDRVLGLHFFNPAPVQPLVEVITHGQVDPTVVQAIEGLMQKLGKKPVTVADQPGFLVNALLVPYLNHAATLLSAGDVEPADLDAAVSQSGFAPMGPAALIDLVGIDVHIEVCKVLHQAFGHAELAPASGVQALASSGFLGRKTKRGYFDYSNELPVVSTPSPRALQYARWLNARHLNAAAAMLQTGYASADDIDLGMMAGCGYQRGPIAAIEELGAQQIIDDLTDAFSQSGSKLDTPCDRLIEASKTPSKLRN
jgi:3-hydroxybutyryl-CoA dehydrogenase